MPNGTLIEANIPPQTDQSQAYLTSVVQTATEAVKQVLTGVLVGSLVLNLLLTASLSLLWGMLNSLQLIMLLPMLNVYVPASATDLFSTLTQISKFNLVPFDWLVDYFVIDGPNNQETSSNF